MNDRQAQAQAKIFTERGYRRVSNTYQRISRVDVPDWRERMAETHAPWDPCGEGMRWVEGLGDCSAADYYRRCHSCDVKTVSASVYQHIPGSGHDPCGYVPLDRHRRPVMSKQLSTPVDPQDLVGKYKVHSINVITGKSCSTANTFHDSFEEAQKKARSIVTRDPDTQIVILKCTHLVQTVERPVEIVDLEELE